MNYSNLSPFSRVKLLIRKPDCFVYFWLMTQTETLYFLKVLKSDLLLTQWLKLIPVSVFDEFEIIHEPSSLYLGVCTYVCISLPCFVSQLFVKPPITYFKIVFKSQRISPNLFARIDCCVLFSVKTYDFSMIRCCLFFSRHSLQMRTELLCMTEKMFFFQWF